MTNKNKLFSNKIQNSMYLGWRGLGSLLGTRYYLNTENGIINIISKSPVKGIELQTFTASDILCVELHKSSFFYAIIGTLIIFFKSLPDAINDNIHEHNGHIHDLSIDILFLLGFSLFIGFIIERLYERPHIEFILKGGAKIKLFTNYHSAIPEVMQLIENMRENNSSSNTIFFNSFYKYQERSLPRYIHNTNELPVYLTVNSASFIGILILILAALIGILAAIIIPAYQDYIIRSKVMTGLVLADEAKLAVTENATVGTSFIKGWTAPSGTDVISSISINHTNGEITITYTAKVVPLGSNTLILSPHDSETGSPLTPGTPTTSIFWSCNSSSKSDTNNFGTLGTILPKYVPSSCR
jgi:type IV pilus assembly protein PilA